MINYRLTFHLGCATMLLMGAGICVSAQTIAVSHHAAYARQNSPQKQPDASLMAQGRISLRQLLTTLENTYQVRFNFKASVVRDILVEPVPITEFKGQLALRLNRVLLSVNLSCTPVGESAFVVSGRKTDPTTRDTPSDAPQENPTRAREISADQTITGTIRNETGEGLPGVTVAQKNTQRGTTTDVNGNFRLTIPESDATLTISYIGYITQEIEVGNQTNLDLRLVPDNKALEEVVVVGYGTQKKVNLTGAVAVVQGTALTDRPVVNATQSLQGLVPGLNVTVGGNTRPGQSFNLNIRGQGNLNGSDSPYVLVDGFEMDLSSVNPNDIESISVLKDAAASAIYGARAAYGVILVTTKKGAPDRMSVSY
jgi:TonB-dependent SusC/RagA subfamily outer membrane receptor